MKLVKTGLYKTQSGQDAKVFMIDSPDSPIYRGGGLGAVLIPRHPAAFPGWCGCEWDYTGKALDNSPAWDLVLETAKEEK